MSGTAKNKTIYLHIVIMFILMFGIGFLPPFGQITAWHESFGVFFGHHLWLVFIDLLWVSFLGLLF